MKDKIYTKEDAEDLTRKEQLKVLKARGIQTSWKDKEPDLIKKILKSNPKEVTPTGDVVKKPAPKEKKEILKNPCDLCGNDMTITGGGPSGTDFYCNPQNNGCGYKLTRGA